MQQPPDSLSQRNNRLIGICRWLNDQRALFWGTIVLGLLVSLSGTWLFTPFSTDYRQLPIGWPLGSFYNASLLLLLGILLLVLDGLVYLGSLLPGGMS